MIHPFISGNKWRKLKYHLAEARTTSKTHLVTFGGAYSNHLLATACAAAKYRFSCTGFVRGEVVSNQILDLCRLFGMQLRFTDRESYRSKKELFNNHFSEDKSTYFIDEGGAGQHAVEGCSELVGELPQAYDHIFCAAGTGSTAAGIGLGIVRNSMPTKLHIVPVIKGGENLATEIGMYSNHLFSLYSDYHFGGYAKTTPELLTFIKDFSSRTGILIEPVYTGKLFYAIYDLIRKDTFLPNSSVIAIHTGGLTGILGMLDRFEF